MTLGPDPVEFESRLDALGRALETAAATPAPDRFVGAVRARRRTIVMRKAGGAACALLALAVLVTVAQKFHEERGGQASETRSVSAPTFAAMRTMEDVDRGPQARLSGVQVSPVIRAGDQPYGEVVRGLVEFK